MKDALPEISLIRENTDSGCTLCRQIEAGELPIRVTHNDTKTNNILFDRDTLDPDTSNKYMKYVPVWA